MNWLFRRLAEPSSAAAIASMIGTVAALGNGALPWKIGGPALLAGLLGIVMPERGGKLGATRSD